MKKRTAFVGAILSLMPIGEPFLIKTVGSLLTSAIIISHTEKVNAESEKFYLDRGKSKQEKGDHIEAISDFTKAIDLNPKDTDVYFLRGISKDQLGDQTGSCIDGKQALSLGLQNNEKKWVEENCL